MNILRKRNFIIVIATLTLGIIVGTISYSTMKERYYEKKYPEFYYIEEYILSIENENDVCDALRYNYDGTINRFDQRYGFEDGHENTVYTDIDSIKLETPSYSIEYTWYTGNDERWLGLGKRELNLTFDVYVKEQQGEAWYTLNYDFNTHEYTETYHHDESGVDMHTKFDERGQEVYNLILDDFTSKIKQCGSE